MYNKKAVQYYKKGLVLNEQGNLTAAERSYKKAIKINKEFAEAHNNLGNVYDQLDDLQNAKNSYERSIKINKNYEITLKMLKIINYKKINKNKFL